MAKKKSKDTTEVQEAVTEAYSKTEEYVNENQKSLSLIGLAIIVLVGGYFMYKNFYQQPLEVEAEEKIWKAEYYFEVDSLDKAINGDGLYYGFQYIADEYSGTKAGNRANYYLGICYLNKGEYETAVNYLQEYDADDQITGVIATGAIGDAYMELNMVDAAIENYEKAIALAEDDFTAPIYLMKAGLAYEDFNNYPKAVEKYQAIKDGYPNSVEAREVDKYLARAETKVSGQ